MFWTRVIVIVVVVVVHRNVFSFTEIERKRSGERESEKKEKTETMHAYSDHVYLFGSKCHAMSSYGYSTFVIVDSLNHECMSMSVPYHSPLSQCIRLKCHIYILFRIKEDVLHEWQCLEKKPTNAKYFTVYTFITCIRKKKKKWKTYKYSSL